MENTFNGLKSLKVLDLSNFDTRNTTYMTRMFYNASGIEHLDISSFKANNALQGFQAFQNLSNLKSIKVSDKFPSEVGGSGSGNAVIEGYFKEWINVDDRSIEYKSFEDLIQTLDVNQAGHYIRDKSVGLEFVVDNESTEIELKYGQMVDETKIPNTDKLGRTFIEWNTKQDGTGVVFTKDSIVTEDLIVYAIYEDNVYSVQFNDNGNISDINVKHGETINSDLFPETGKENSYFVEWNTKSDGTGSVFTDETIVNESMVVYAIYKSNEYTVTFNVDGVITVVNVNHGQTVLESDIPSISKEDFAFKEWNTKQDGTGLTFNIDQEIVENLELFAIYDPISEVGGDRDLPTTLPDTGVTGISYFATTAIILAGVIILRRSQKEFK